MLKLIHSKSPLFLNVAVIGASGSGVAIAGYLASIGHQVKLYDEAPENLHPIIMQNGIRVSGHTTGFGKIDIATTQIQEALSGSEIILITTPASKHRQLAALISTLITDQQLILLVAAESFGAWDFKQTLIQQNCFAKTIIAETQSHVLNFQSITKDHCRILEIENRIPVAAIKSDQVYSSMQKLRRLFPQLIPVENILHSSLMDVRNFIFPAILTLNDALNGADQQLLSKYNLKISLLQLIHAIDLERTEVAVHLGVKIAGIDEWLRISNNSFGASFLQTIIQGSGHSLAQNSQIPSYYSTNLGIAYNLVPLLSLGRMFGLPLEKTEAIINIASDFYNQNYISIGRTVDNLGISGMTLGEIQQFASGQFENRRVFN
ncbi:MAG: hypothetical protein IPH88_05265 [Bacteroidales bacterium]|nr:hypothetical protein [Bacteroidales bacterium]